MFFAIPAAAQTYPSPTFNNVTITGTLNGGILTISPYVLTPLGHQVFSSATLATAQSLTVPTGATIIDIYPEGTPGTNNICVRYFDDGTVPTSTSGAGLSTSQVRIGYASQPASAGALSSIKFILAAGATCTLTINYYK
jgi:hypothetical protein